ncbi:MAG: hypothetical protein ACLQAT_31210 [Candidatus Binataceae bacterium]
MKRRFESNSTWITVVCVIGALLIGAWIGLHVSASLCTEDDWIEAIQSGDAR